jgi:hypothetical protein
MHVSKRTALGAAAIAAAALTVPALANPHSPQGGQGSIACNDGTITWNPTNLWPPNHKYVPISISYSDTDNDGGATGETTMVTVDSVTETDGDGAALDATVAETVNGSGKPGQIDAQPDADHPATNGSDPNTPATFTEDLRAERSGTDGHGSGRVYDMSVTCTDSAAADPNHADEAAGEMQTVDLQVTVPHDQGVVKP